MSCQSEVTGALLVAVGICGAATELSGSDETAERVSPECTQHLGQRKQADRSKESTV